MRGLIDDCRHALRLYRRTPAASLIVVVVLAVAMAFIGTLTQLYVDLALAPDSRFEASEELVTLDQSDGSELFGFPGGLIERAADEISSLDAIVGVQDREHPREDGVPVAMELVSRDFFDGMRPVLHSGRGFERSEHQADGAPVVVISHRYWQDELGGRPDVLGTTIGLDVPVFDGGADQTLEQYRIVGVMAEAMRGLASNSVDVWLPLERFVPLDRIGTLWAFGRRQNNASVESLREELNERYLGVDGLAIEAGSRLEVEDGVVSDVQVQRDAKRQLRLLLAASVLLGVVAAANVSLFLLARAPGRVRELGIRVAVGARPARLSRQLATEASLLVLVASVPALLISVWLSGLLPGLAFLREADWGTIALLDMRVLAATGCLLLALAALVSVAPVRSIRRLGIESASRQIRASATPAQRIAGTAQVAAAGALGGAALAFAWHLMTLIFADPGYLLEKRYVVRYSTNITIDSAEALQRYRDFQAAQVVELPGRRESIESLPGVSAVSFGEPVPGQSVLGWTRIADPHNAGDMIMMTAGSIDSRYVDVLGLQLLAGRSPMDGEQSVALVNRAFAEWHFGRDDIIGETITLAPVPNPPQLEIIGVLEDVSFGHPSAVVEPMMFRSQDLSVAATVVVESSLTAAELQQELERLAEAGPPEIGLRDVRPLEALRRDQLAPDRARGLLAFGTALLVVSLCAFGFYGTQHYLVGAGRKEYAIRSSLGAGPRAVGRLVLLRGLLLGLPGLVLGGFLAFIVVSLIRDDYLTSEISPGAVTIAVVAGLSLLLLVASFGPALDARRTQPAPLLKED